MASLKFLLANKNFKEAIDYYNICIAMKNHAFKNSMDQKAKSGIIRCNRN